MWTPQSLLQKKKIIWRNSIEQIMIGTATMEGQERHKKENQLLYFISFILLAISPGVIFSYNIRKHAG